MLTISLDASGWERPDDFFGALLPGLRAPSWHGRNLDALNDSIFVGDINEVEPPFRVVVNGTDALHGDMRNFLREVEALFQTGQKNTGMEVYIDFLPSL
jgi:RNAse (barnase) inhibitor barstar